MFPYYQIDRFLLAVLCVITPTGGNEKRAVETKRKSKRKPNITKRLSDDSCPLGICSATKVIFPDRAALIAPSTAWNTAGGSMQQHHS